MKNLPGIPLFRTLMFSAMAVVPAESSPEPRWRMIESITVRGEIVVAPFTVLEFGADPAGTQDSTAAFQEALAAVSKLGGGALWVPEGRYRLEGSLEIPSGVTLRGEWMEPGKGRLDHASILMAFGGRGNEKGMPLVTLQNNSGLNGLVFWYPEQKADAPAAYPPTVLSRSGSLEKLTFVNSWRAYQSDSNGNSLYYLRRVHMTALSVGMELDAAYDIGRIEQATLSPEIWSDSGLPGAPARGGAHEGWMRGKAIGIIMRRNDWSYLYDVRIRGFQAGFRTLPSLAPAMIRSGRAHYANGQNYGLTIEECAVGLDLEDVNRAGIAFARSEIKSCDQAVLGRKSYTGNVFFHTCVLDGNRDALRNEGKGIFMLESTRILRGNVHAEGGALLISGGDFSNAQPQLSLGDGIQNAMILGNRFTDGKAPPIHLRAHVQVDPTPRTAVPMPTYPYRLVDGHGPAKRAFYNVQDASWGAKGDGKADDTGAFAKALAAAGAHGGGLVFVPPGQYRITKALEVPSGVELKGSSEVPHRAEPWGSLILVEHGRGQSDGDATFTVKSKGGMRGINFHYPLMVPTSFEPYPFLIRGDGSDLYLIHLTATCVPRFIDLASKRCDRHLVDYVAGAPLFAGILVGAGSTGGVVMNGQFNPIYFTHTRTFPSSFPVRFPKMADRKPLFMPYFDYQWTNLIAYGIGDVRDQVMHENFVFGSKYGFHHFEQEGRGGQVHLVGNGVDQTAYPFYFDGSGAYPVTHVNAQLVTVNRIPREKAYVVASERQKAPMSILGISAWGGADAGVISKSPAPLDLQGLIFAGKVSNTFVVGDGPVRVNLGWVEEHERLFPAEGPGRGLKLEGVLVSTALAANLEKRFPLAQPFGPITMSQNSLSGLGGLLVLPYQDDQGKTRFETKGTWGKGGWCMPGPGQEAAWSVRIPESGNYLVEAFMPADPNRDHCTRVSYTIKTSGGPVVKWLNPRGQAGQLVPLGIHRFDAGWATVVLDASTGDGNHVVGPVRFVAAPEGTTGQGRERWITCQGGSTNGMTFIANTDEGKVKIAVEGGGPGWGLLPGKAPGRFLYFRMLDESLRNGMAKTCNVHVRYFDSGKGPLNINYDSLEEGKGSTHRLVNLANLKDSRTWKTAELRITDARFGGRCSGHDFRIGFPKEAEPLVDRVVLRFEEEP